ncbi:hypothetical protein NUW58_g418 [Xylaria curta]|uniref:Uncharacterized protein n=1 Tax=Xylaria curta TaxID=42375 RepID=A0ACC1PPE3_9PEZI|nr:hypothetical protein NUW58_g418 [Xylaria curta]
MAFAGAYTTSTPWTDALPMGAQVTEYQQGRYPARTGFSQNPKRPGKVVPVPKRDPGLDKARHSPSSSVPSTYRDKKFEATRGTNSEIDELPNDYSNVWKFKEAVPDYSDSNDSIDSRSTVSQASTATTVDENALEALFRGLLNQKGLNNLWPQIVVGQISRSDARHTIDRFIRRFAEDLECLATKTNDVEDEASRRIILSSSKFVRRHRAKITSRICQAHETQEKFSYADTDTEDTAVIIEDTPDADSDPFTFSIAEDFIFGTEPIRYLEVNLASFIRQREQKQFSPLATNLRSFVSSVTQFLFHAPRPSGKKRVKWTCICGYQVIDDYESKHEGAVEALEYRLKQYNQATQSYGQDNETGQSSVATPDSSKGPISTIIQWFRKAFTKPRSRGLPSHRNDSNGPSIQLGSCGRSARLAQAHHNFVLLCVPYLRWGLRLHNSEICRINSDQQFFQLLRQCYRNQRVGNIRGIFRIFTKVRALQFVKFEVFRNKLVDVRACPSMPTPGNEYAYDPTDTIPPIGSNMLMHLFENPEHADVTLFLYNRFPKKLRAQLEACPLKGSSIGWGVEFVEGVDWHIVFAVSCLGFLFCLIFAVAWAATKGDIQGGFGIASFLLAFVVFCISDRKQVTHLTPSLLHGNGSVAKGSVTTSTKLRH